MRHTGRRTRRRQLWWTGATGALLGIPLTLSAAGDVPTDPSHSAAPAIIPTAAGNDAAPAATSSNPQFQADRYEAEVQRQLYMLYQQSPQRGSQLPAPNPAAPGPRGGPPKPRKLKLKDYFNPSAWKRQYERRQRYNAYLERQREQQAGSPLPDAQLGSPGEMTHGGLVPSAPSVALPPNADSRRSSQTAQAPSTSGTVPATPFGAPAPLPATVQAKPQLQRVSPELFGLTPEADGPTAPDSSSTFELLLPETPAPSEEPELMPATVATDLSPVEPETPMLLIVPNPERSESSLPQAPAAEFEQPRPVARTQRDDGFLSESDDAFETPRTASAESADSGDNFALPVEEEFTESTADAESSSPFTGLELQENPFADPPAEAVELPAPLSAPAAQTPMATTSPPATTDDAPAPMLLAPPPTAAESDDPSPVPLAAPQATTAPAQLATTAPATLPSPDAGLQPPAAVASANRNMRPDVRAKLDRIAARQGLTGFKGFCPVMLTDYRELVDAKLEHTVEYEGRRYWFSSAAAREKFMLDPTAYAPARGGLDVMIFDETGESREGSLDHAVWYRGKLYLFDTAESRAAFAAAPNDHVVTQ